MTLSGFIAEWVAARVGRSVTEISENVTFEALGLDSESAVELSGQLERYLDRTLSPTVLYEHPTISALAAALESSSGSRSEDWQHVPRRSTPAMTDQQGVAIVGLGCRLPGGVTSPATLWALVRDGVDAIGPVPEGRWPSSEGMAELRRHGGFLDAVDDFDAEAFEISAREAATVDPQQRILLEVAWEALEDAMISPDSLAGTGTGVFVGISGTDWSHLTLRDATTIDRYAATGSALSIAANRLSYTLDLHGPSFAIDTACSSSLVAVDLARRSLQSGECDIALVAGVNLLLRPHVSLALAQAGMLSTDGRCRSFAEGADGFGRGEGACVAILKPVATARADGDRIYAVLRGSATGSDGRTNGLTAPSGRGQRAVISAACRSAQVAPSDVGYVEGQGTGTPLGDSIEAEALGSVLGRGRGLDRPCAIGSIKSNIGHLEAAAGLAALTKAALAIHHLTLPASLHAGNPRADIPFEVLGLRLQSETCPWPKDVPVVAGVSAFGFGGANAHAILAGR